MHICINTPCNSSKNKNNNKKHEIKQRRFSLGHPLLSLLFFVEKMTLHRFIHARRDRVKGKKTLPPLKHKRRFNNPRPIPYSRDIQLARWDPSRVSPPSPNRYNRHSPSSS